MEESESRRERLKAMRMEASQAGVPSDDGFSTGLANPLVEASGTPSVYPDPNVAPRFGYYTDPMAAFSVNKGRSKVSHQIPPDYFTPPRPRNADISPRPYHIPGPYGSPVGSPGTFGAPQQGNMNVPHGAYGFPSNMPRGGHFPGPQFVQRGSPSANYAQSRGYGFNNSPQAGSGNWGRPFPHTGRGRSPWRGGHNPGSMQSGARTGPRDNVSAEVRPNLYYDKSMVEDPWKTLKPVVWRRGGLTSLDAPSSSKSWLPKSIISKKARVSEEPVKYTAGSLAEDLAASFHAAASYEPQGDSAKDNF